MYSHHPEQNFFYVFGLCGIKRFRQQKTTALDDLRPLLPRCFASGKPDIYMRVLQKALPALLRAKCIAAAPVFDGERGGGNLHVAYIVFDGFVHDDLLMDNFNHCTASLKCSYTPFQHRPFFYA